jgi:hypothetical protein
MREFESESTFIDFEGASSSMSKEDMQPVALIRGEIEI